MTMMIPSWDLWKISHNSDIDRFLNAERIIIEEELSFKREQDSETIELLVRRGVIYDL